jgi:signal transduction histidine kinase
MSKHKSEISNRKSMLSKAELSQIEQATAEYDWETVRDLINQALAGSGLAPVEEFDLRKKLGKALDNLGEYDAAEDDIRRMIALARSLDDDARLANALNMLAFNQILITELDRASAAAEEARSLAVQLKNKPLEARALNMLAWVSDTAGDFAAKEAYLRQALALAENGASPKDESWALRELGNRLYQKNEQQQADAYGRRAIEIARANGDRFGELLATNAYSYRRQDLAKMFTYKRRAIALARAIDNRGMISIINNSLAWFYWRFGLFRRAAAHAKEAVRHQRKARFLVVYMNSLDTLAFMARSAGEFDLARRSYKEIIESRREGRTRDYYYGLDGLGRLALDEKRYADAVPLLQEAIEGFIDAGIVDAEASTKTWLAVAYLAGDDPTRALQLIDQALALAQSEEQFGIEHPRQEIWWQYYRILKATNGQASTDDRWQTLEQARQALFEPVANIGDEGLRRNYLNKVPSNRAISETWAREASARGISLAPFTERETAPAALAEQLQRIVESGARLASERDVSKLTDFILQEFIELSGAERAIVAIRRPGEPLRWASTSGFDAKEQGEVADLATPFIRRASKTLAPLLVDSAGEVPQGDVPELHLRSALILPMISQGKLWGVLYGDMRHLFGRLNENDRDILSLLANQVGAALENADWVETLEQQVADRTAEAEAAREEAERANKAKSAFMSNMSHELRTPLNAIMGFTRIVRRKTEDQIPQKQTENLDKVLGSGEHLLGLINTILDIAKIESGRMDVINSRFHIGQLIEATTTVSQPLLQPGVDLNLNIALGLPEISSDQDKIKQILLNLLSNAAKFTREGSITVRAHQESDTIFITVTDTGIGMNEEALSRVFEEFQQADATTRKKYGGTGLGMPISRHLAQLLGGDLTVTSTEGEGSTFTLTLPIEAVSF